jgi:hypothetical protein
MSKFCFVLVNIHILQFTSTEYLLCPRTCIKQPLLESNSHYISSSPFIVLLARSYYFPAIPLLSSSCYSDTSRSCATRVWTSSWTFTWISRTAFSTLFNSQRSFPTYGVGSSAFPALLLPYCQWTSLEIWYSQLFIQSFPLRASSQ